MRAKNCFVSFAYLLVGGAAYAASFSAVNDFSLAANPNGPWSYSYAGMVLPTPVVGTGTLAGASYWWTRSPSPTAQSSGKVLPAAPWLSKQ